MVDQFDTSSTAGANSLQSESQVVAPTHDSEHMQQLTIYISETDRVEHKPLYLKILELVKANSGAGATVLKGLAGYSSSSRTIQTAGFADVQQKLPLMVLIVDAAWRVELMLPQLESLVRPNGGLITVQDLEAHRYLHPDLTHGTGRTGAPTVSQIMERHVVTVRLETLAADVVYMLLGKYYKSLPVVDSNKRVVGMITDGDLLEKGKLPFRLSILEALEASGERGLQEILTDLRASHKTAAEIMSTRPLITITADVPALEAARVMTMHGVKRIPVVDASGRLTGIVGRLDVLKAANTIFPGLEAEGEGSAGEQPHNLVRLSDIIDMSPPVITASTPIHEVVEALVAAPGVHRLIVVGDMQSKLVVGIVADRDLIMRVHHQSRPGLLRMLGERLSFRRLAEEQQTESSSLQARVAADAMSGNVVTAPAMTPLGEAVRLLVQGEIKLLPVVDRAGSLLGAINRRRILRALVDEYGQSKTVQGSK